MKLKVLLGPARDGGVIGRWVEDLETGELLCESWRGPERGWVDGGIECSKHHDQPPDVPRRDVMAARGMPPDVLPPEPVPAETRRDSLLPVVQSVSEPPEREAGRLAFGGLIEGRADPGGQAPLAASPGRPPRPAMLHGPRNPCVDGWR